MIVAGTILLIIGLALTLCSLHRANAADPGANHATNWLNAHTAFEQAADELERQRLKTRIEEIEAATVWKMTRTNGRIHVEFLDGSEVEGPSYD